MKALTAPATEPEIEVIDGIDEKVKDELDRDEETVADQEDQELTTDEQKVRAGWDGMSNRLFRVLTEEILPLKTRHHKSEAEYKYRVGKVYAEILDQHAVYGNGDAEMFAKVLDCSRTTLDDYGHVASTWPIEHFRELMCRQFATRPETLSFSHLIEIASELDEDERNGWIEKTLKYGWSVKVLSAKMKPKVEAVQVDEPPVENEADLIEQDEFLAGQDVEDTPQTVRQAIVRTRGTLREVLGAEDEWQERVVRPLGDNPGHFGQPTRDELISIREVCDEVIGRVEAYRTQVDDLLNLTPEDALDDEVEEGGESNE